MTQAEDFNDFIKNHKISGAMFIDEGTEDTVRIYCTDGSYADIRPQYEEELNIFISENK